MQSYALTDEDRKYIMLSALKIKAFCLEKRYCIYCPFDTGSACVLDELRPDRWKVERRTDS